MLRVLICFLVPIVAILPKSWIVAFISKRVAPPGFHFTPTFSGRTAIVQYANQIAKCDSRRTALIPDYVCNVVCTAFEHAGYHILTYKTNAESELCEDIRPILESGSVSVLVGVPIYGATGLLDWCQDQENQSILDANRVHLLFDFCQSLGLTAQLSKISIDYVAAVVSFNNKTIPGAMGGGVVSRHSSLSGSSEKSCTTAQEWQLTWSFYRCAFRDALRSIARKLLLIESVTKLSVANLQQPEYSYCQFFPYALDIERPSKIQLVISLTALTFESITRRRRIDFITSHEQEIVPTPFARESAYVLLRPECDWNGQIKAPYGRHGTPNITERPNSRAVFTNGWS